MLEGTLEKRGNWRRWAPIALRLTGNQLAVVDLTAAGKPSKEVAVVAHVEGINSKQKNEEFAFTVHFEGGVSKKGILGGKETKWVLKASSGEQYDKWMTDLVAGVKGAKPTEQPQQQQQQHPLNTPPVPANGDFSFGLPPFDPRTDLPIASVPQQYSVPFAFLRMAVIHWMDKVKCLESDFGTEENVAVLGDKCVYLCSETADVRRCIKVVDIQKVLVAQDGKKDLYIILVLPEKIQVEGKPNCPEFDLMFHCPDIKSFVRYLRTVYMHQTQGSMLPLEQLRDKNQLENEIRLKKPEGWSLNYWQPMLKEHLKTVLDMWEKSNKFEENEKFKQKVASMLDSNDVLGPPPDTPTPPPYTPSKHVDPETTDKQEEPTVSTTRETETASEDIGPMITDLPPGGEADPLGRFLQQAGLAQYYEPLSENNITLDLLNSGLIDDVDLQHFGVAIPGHRARILSRSKDPAHIDAAKKTPETKPLLLNDDLDLDLDLDDDDKKKSKPKDVFDDSLLDMDLGDVLGSTATDKSVSKIPDSFNKEEANGRSAVQTQEAADRGDIEAAHNAFAPTVAECDTSQPLGKFLKALKLPQYYGYLSERDITLETLACGLVDNDSLKLFGIDNADHRVTILKGLEDKDLVGDEGLDWITTTEDPIEPLKRLEFSTRTDIKDLQISTRTTLITRFTEEMPAPTDIDDTDPLARFLKAIGLPQYYWGLTAKDMTLDVMTSGLVDEDDLKNHCDIDNAADRKRLQAALKDKKLIEAATEGGDLAQWSVAGAARNRIVESQNKILEIGGLTIDDDLLGGVPPPAAAASPPKAAAVPVAKAEVKAKLDDDEDLLGSVAPPPAAAPVDSVDDDLLGGALPPTQPPPPASADDDLLGGPAPVAGGDIEL
eukprot:TRINITY_DN3202_c0_g1_i1.p1 TRINITY_DN3202_c0_g1~~TRINITY_DN3202_c0_g1_i1.p1  ORF type:complete len:886 (+),score=189.55 TRINITY_DN3202_c0_g1_i1:51-2708(+)